jgi:hypothetical protein
MYIYGLQDPETKECRYVGFTSGSLVNRLICHISEAKKQSKRHKERWIRTLFTRQLLPEIFEIAPTRPDCWQEDERFYIAYFKYIGCRLTNACAGGEGAVGRAHTKEEIKQITASNKRTYAEHPEIRQYIANKVTGFRHNAASRLKMSEAKQGKKLANEHICKIKISMSAPQVVKQMSRAAKTMIRTSESNLKRSKTLRTKIAINKAKLGIGPSIPTAYKLNEVTRARIRLGNQAYWRNAKNLVAHSKKCKEQQNRPVVKEKKSQTMRKLLGGI